MDISYQEVFNDHDSPIRNQQITELKTRIRESLKLKGGNKWLDVSPEIEEKLVFTIAETTYEVSKYLDLPYVAFGYIKANEHKKFEDQDPDNRIVSAQAYLDTRNDGSHVGVIEYSAKFLKQVAQYFTDPDLSVHAENLVRWTSAHELYHIRQALRWHKVFDLEASRINDAEDKEDFYKRWYQARIEYGSQLFAANYLQSKLQIDTHSGDVVTRTLAALDNKQSYEEYLIERNKRNGLKEAA